MPIETAVQPEYLTLPQAAKACPSRTHESALYRWIVKGVLSRSGARIKLEHLRVGRKMFTTREWLFTFFRELAAANVAYAEQRECQREADRFTVATTKAAPISTSAGAQRAMAALAADGI